MATTKGAALSFAFVVAASASVGCRKQGLDDQDQIGSSVGEMMASLDESANGSATATLMPPIPLLRTPEQLKGPLWRRSLRALMPSAYAASCLPVGFSACSAGVRTETFSNCTVGAATLDGEVTLTFSRTAACVVLTTGDSVNRTADFTLTGPYGGTLTVTSPGGGQTLTRTDTGFQYAVAGMERVLVGPGGHTLFDISTDTSSPLVITGSSRTDLVIASGALQVQHHLAGYTVTLQPNNLTWASNCNCAVSGSLTGTVSGGKLDGKSATVQITSCGHAEVTVDGDSESVTLDRCVAL
jgi:hypothetical protein